MVGEAKDGGPVGPDNPGGSIKPFETQRRCTADHVRKRSLAVLRLTIHLPEGVLPQ